MSFTKREQQLLVEMFLNDRFRISANGQNIYNSAWFFDIISKLSKDGFVRGFKENGKTSYQLTTDGIALGYLLSKKLDRHEKEILLAVLW